MSDHPQYGDKSTEDKARNRQAEIEHRLRNDITITLAASDAVQGDEDQIMDLVAMLVSDAMHQIDLLLVELY